MTFKEKVTAMTNAALSQITLDAYGPGAFFGADVNEARRLCLEYFKKTRKAGIPNVVDGFLFIDGVPMGRIAPLSIKTNISEKAAYYEGRCISNID
jgi:hypothetical protein